MNLPTDFLALLKSYKTDIFRNIETGLSEKPSVAIRYNPKRNYAVSDEKIAVPWSINGYYLPERRPFTFDPLFHQGVYYVQDPSSMIIERIVSQLTKNEPITYLDACAAPGGKTTAAMSVLPRGSVVVANEYDFKRVNSLRENILKWGFRSAIVTSCDTAKYRKLDNFFDIVAIDAPCSGEGMMRKDPDAVTQWSPALIEKCKFRQIEIIDNLVSTVKGGGYLIYSTCTFNRAENEEIAEYIVNKYGFLPIELNLPDNVGIENGIDADFPCYRFIPGLVMGEGLFVAVFQKPRTDVFENTQRRKKSENLKTKVKKTLSIDFSSYFNGDFSFEIDKDGRVNAFSTADMDTLIYLRNNLQVLSYGIEVGQVLKNNVVPSHSLALCESLNHSAFPSCEVDRVTAIKYLQRQAISLDKSVPKGYILLTYNGNVLGFVKNLGNRANNLYPQSMRILSTHIPPL